MQTIFSDYCYAVHLRPVDSYSYSCSSRMRCVMIVLTLTLIQYSTQDDAKTVTHQCSNAEVEAVRFLLYTHGYTGGQSVHTSSDSTRKMKLCPSKSLQSPPSCNCREPEIIEYRNLTSIAITRYDPKHPVKLLIHGFMQHDGTNFPKNVRQAYQAVNSKFNYNIIVVDWGKLACTAHQEYSTALKNVGKVGQHVGKFISWLHTESLVSLNNTHIVGHSLGSHVAGKAGDTVNRTVGYPVGRITGLDPAGPEYEVEVNPARGIRPNDAQFVDIIHTNVGEFGITRRVGHSDFYVNTGNTQPECATAVNDVFCSHQMSTWYYANTIKKMQDNKRCACKTAVYYPIHVFCCDAKVKFGEYSEPGVSGAFYLIYRMRDSFLRGMMRNS